MQLVNANKRLIEIFEQKIKNKNWGCLGRESASGNLTFNHKFAKWKNKVT